ncbi:MAG: nucleotidyltransferase family protein [Candidatus Omnitrophica bacterium]|nr:nucleotidyltransferase family protein [Candidatus Omnitrophota bacterium]
MKVIILCAGYAVRLYPLTENTPKPLLPVGDRPMLEHLLDRVRPLKEIDQLFIVTNTKFAGHFESWNLGQKVFDRQIVVINDGTTSNETRLGALGDLNLVLEQGRVQDDVLVLAGDNFFTFDLEDFVSVARTHNPFASIGIYDVKDPSLAKNYGLVEVQPNDKIRSFLEKPQNPTTTLASTGVYYFPQGTLQLLDLYLSEKNNPDAPGYFIQWLIKRSQVYGVKLEGSWYDIGDLASYKTVNQLMQKKSV